MIKVAELFSDEDKTVKQRIDAKNELESLVFIFIIIFIFEYFLFSYTYSLRNQLKDQKGFFGELSLKEQSTITNAVENQIKWIDSNTDAKTDEFIKQKKQLERIVLQIMSTIHGYKPNNNRTQNHGEL
jgi:molecular chaperone DnaK (HSP70)